MTATPAEAWAACSQGQIIVVTGEIGAGKTTWCRDLIAHVRNLGLRAAGLSSPGVFVDGQKVAIDLLDLATDQQRRLADRLAVPDTASPTPNWKFHAETLAWGNTVLKSIDTCDLLVIDELGPLELRHNQGWQHALSLLKQPHFRAACVIVRRSLLETCLAILPDAALIEIERKNANPP
jgi:nucleoside-triphosphatase THEP1